jgi:prepilin-type N-terminal cleavage/methylation domain-containing protein
MNAERGFTLIEVLMALTVFALIVGLGYGALGIAGEGFGMLAKVRNVQERSGWIGRQLRSDVAYIAASEYHGASVSSQPSGVQPLRINNDNRGESEFDELWLLVREPDRPGISQVHYYLDEDSGHIIRESRLLWARDSAQAQKWDLGEASSWAVEVQNREGQWQQMWQSQKAGRGALIWPRALRVSMRNEMGERQWLLPVSYGGEL